MKLQKIVISTNNDENYLPYWKYIAYAWKVIFNVEPVLAYLVSKQSDRALIGELEKSGKVYVYEAVPDLPYHNQAKMIRHHLAGCFGAEVCSLNDVDLLPLQSEYFLELLEQHQPGQIFCMNPYFRNHQIGYLTAESYVLSEVFKWKSDPHEFLNQFRSYSGKSCIEKNLPNGDPDGFCDETLLMELLQEWDPSGRKIKVVDRGYNPHTERTICRSALHLYDNSKLLDNTYVEYHLPHPFDLCAITPFMDHIKKTFTGDVWA